MLLMLFTKLCHCVLVDTCA